MIVLINHFIRLRNINFCLFSCFFPTFFCYSAPEKQMVIVIPSYNNSMWYKRNLTSVLTQNYSHFSVLYTDDCSSDNTGALVDLFIKEYDKENRITLIQNKKRRGALHNLYSMIHSAPDDAIIVTLDGDDWLPDENTLARLNEVYSRGISAPFDDTTIPAVCLTYGQFKLYPSDTIGWASAMPDYVVQTNSFRDFQHLPTHLRTFYAWLFKQIKLEDLLHHGRFFSMTWDMAMMFPMIEMVGEHHAFISDIMYTYNDINTISDHRISRQLQAHLAQIIREKKRYRRLVKKPVPSTIDNKPHTDVIIFSEGTTSQLDQFLQSLDRHVSHIAQKFVLYKPISQKECQAYKSIQIRYPDVHFYIIDNDKNNFCTTFATVYARAQSPFTLFTKSDLIFSQTVDLNNCVQNIINTHAYAFYFKLTAHDDMSRNAQLPLVEINDEITAWVFAYAQGPWSCANSFDTVLHRKSDVISSLIPHCWEQSPEGFQMIWANEGNLDRIGLCFNENHVQVCK